MSLGRQSRLNMRVLRPLLSQIKRCAWVPLVAIFALGASQCNTVRVDSSAVFAAEAGDKTVIIEGCGNQPVVGYTYCRVREGDPTTGKITFIAPPVKCNTKPCVSFTLFFPDGSPSLGFQLPDNTTRLDVPWSDLTKTIGFNRQQRGFWPVVMRWKWLSAADGREYESYAEGEIRLRVLSANYLPLNEIHDDPNFAWAWVDGKKHFKMTTAGRAAAWSD